MRLLAALVALLVGTALAFPAVAQDAPRTITLEGVGEVRAQPDTAFVTSGVTTQGATAREALDANTAAMNELMSALTGAGIEARDIQTSGFSVNPNYVYTDARDANGYTLPPKINGYTVANMVTVRVRDIASLGGVLDQAVTVGANTINGVSFAVDDPRVIQDEARKRAFADAERKAKLYAGEAGLDLDRIRTIGEMQDYGQPQPYLMRAEAAMSADAAPVPVAAGEMSYTIRVSVTWDID